MTSPLSVLLISHGSQDARLALKLPHDLKHRHAGPNDPAIQVATDWHERDSGAQPCFDLAVVHRPHPGELERLLPDIIRLASHGLISY